jgi:FkbH-like protein
MKTYSQIQNYLNQNRDTNMNLPALRISILRNITLEPIKPYLQYFASQIGYQAEVLFGNYDNVFQESAGSNSSLLSPETDIVLVFTKLENLSWSLTRGFAGLNSDQVQDEKNRLAGYFLDVLAGIRLQTRAMIIWHGFEMPDYPSLGISDGQLQTGQMDVIVDLNRNLKKSLAGYPNAFFLDTSQCQSRLGHGHYYDPRYWQIARAPYTREALADIAGEEFKFIRALKGKNKKCLVLDCDNVLWGGIIGEDGLAGIKLGKTYPGSAYYEFQQELVNLYHRGVILALCSKNNASDVWDVFQKHPDMILKEEHIAVAQINWQDKAANLRQIALDLNIGLDSIVFMDDSEFEVGLIRSELPEVEVVHLLPEKAIGYRAELISGGWFDTLTITQEDKARGEMYKADASRKKIRAEAIDLKDYYASLEMVAEIRFADEFAIPRIAQLTQKTNQFNLTTRRYSEADIQAFVLDGNADVLSLCLKDRFGDLGLVGVCILKYQEKKTHVDTFLFSCRALGRKAEELLLGHCLMLAKSRANREAIGFYTPTKKNEQVKDFYPSHGFVSVGAQEDEQGPFKLDLDRYEFRQPDFYKNVISEIFPILEGK